MIHYSILAGCVITFLFLVGVWVWLIFYDKQKEQTGRSVTWFTAKGEAIRWQIFTNENPEEDMAGEEPGIKVV